MPYCKQRNQSHAWPQRTPPCSFVNSSPDSIVASRSHACATRSPYFMCICLDSSEDTLLQFFFWYTNIPVCPYLVYQKKNWNQLLECGEQTDLGPVSCWWLTCSVTWVLQSECQGHYHRQKSWLQPDHPTRNPNMCDISNSKVTWWPSWDPYNEVIWA